MKVKDIPGDAMFISDSQDVSPILDDFGIVDDDIGGVFITKDGKVYGISGSVAYLEYHVFYIGQDANYASDEQRQLPRPEGHGLPLRKKSRGVRVADSSC